VNSAHPILDLPIASRGAIGDRRTGALAAADGTIDWFCVPDFDGPPIFGSLLDQQRGGFCRFGPSMTRVGRQCYLPDTVVLVTSWSTADDCPEIELSDVMVWPGEERPEAASGQRAIIRRLHTVCEATICFAFRPRWNFAAPSDVTAASDSAVFQFTSGIAGCWSSFPLQVAPAEATATFTSHAGQVHWVVLGWNVSPDEWSISEATQQFASAEAHWRNWSAELKVKGGGSRTAALKRSALTVQLLSHVHHESAVAALTTSLPEQLGANRNYDYRYAWVRDASLSLALLARMGKTAEVKGYLEWLCRLDSSTNSPLQVCYRLDGNTQLDQEDLSDLRGYAGSIPVRRGNRAAKQRQLGSLGFFADCARIYFDHGGEWRDEFWRLLRRAADYTCAHWQEEDSGVWELPTEAHYVASRVMSWVVLQRALYLAEKFGHSEQTDHWPETAEAIHAEVMDKGWCKEKNAFRQRYGSDALDAAALLIPLMEFLPVDHPRVAGTLAAIERELVVDGLVHRFDPEAMPGGDHLPIGEEEGAFLPCVFWHAHTLAKAGRCDEAEVILRKCESIAGEVGLFAEEADARHHTFLGNTPLLFSQVEYARAVIELNTARARAATLPAIL
jgi:GH15 family glucan-1,4-alpha-glucosidase